MTLTFTWSVDNLGTGIFISRWGGDGMRAEIQIYNNTVHHNGYGPAQPATGYHWMTGGLYLFSANLENVEIKNNIFSDNKGFQIGYSDLYLASDPDIDAVLRRKQIDISNNLIFDCNEVEYPITVGWPDNYANVYVLTGTNAVVGEPLFVDPAAGDFALREGPPALGAVPGGGLGVPVLGAWAFGVAQDFWWKADFPPRIE